MRVDLVAERLAEEVAATAHDGAGPEPRVAEPVAGRQQRHEPIGPSVRRLGLWPVSLWPVQLWPV